MGAILLGGLALRWPPPGWSHYDEVAFVVIPLGFWGGDLNPHFFNYPTFHFYLCSLIYYLKYLASGGVSAEQFAAHRYFVYSADLLHLARAVQVCFSLGAVYLSAALGRRLYGWSGGLLAGLLMAILPLNVRFACLASTDVPAVFWAMLATLFSLRLLQEGRTRDLILAGVAAGLAGATKYPAVLAVVPVVAAALLRVPSLRQPALWWAVLAAALTFGLATPYVALDPQGFWRDFSQMGRDHLLTARIAGPAWFFHLEHSLRYGVGLAGLLAAGLALARRPRRWRAEEVLLGVTALALALPLMVGSSVFMRYALPVAPVVAVLAARTIGAARRPLLVVGLAALVAAEPLYRSLHTRQLLSGPDTRGLARQWLADRFPGGSPLISVPPECGGLEVLTPHQVYVRQTHYLRSYGERALRRVYEDLAGREGLPPLYLELGSDLEEVRRRLRPAPGDSLADAALVWSRHPVCPEEPGLGEGDPLLAGGGQPISPGDLAGAQWDPMDWYFLPLSGFAGSTATGPEIRVEVVRLRGSAAVVDARTFFAALASALEGHEAFAAQRWEQAARAYAQVLDTPVPPGELLGPALTRHVLAQLGRAELGWGRPLAAVQALEQARSLAPADPEVYSDLGIARAAAGQPGAAAEVLEECLALHPEFAPAYFNLGRLLAGTGQLERAKTYWRRGLQLMPAHPMATQLKPLLGGD